MRLLIMGAGYVGMALLEALQKEPYELWITTTQKTRVESLKTYGERVIALDPESQSDLEEAIDGCDGLMILIAPNGQTYEETYLRTAKRISKALRGRRTPFYLLYTSSTSVLQESVEEWVSEEKRPAPKSENGKILVEAENLYLNCGVNSCILRLGGIYGPGRELLKRASRLSGQEMSGNGEDFTNHIHLEDIVAGILFCIEHSLKGIYHLVNEAHPTRQELYSILSQSLSLPPPIWRTGCSTESKRGYRVSNAKIKKAGFKFKFPQLNPLEGISK